MKGIGIWIDPVFGTFQIQTFFFLNSNPNIKKMFTQKLFKLANSSIYGVK